MNLRNRLWFRMKSTCRPSLLNVVKQHPPPTSPWVATIGTFLRAIMWISLNSELLIIISTLLWNPAFIVLTAISTGVVPPLTRSMEQAASRFILNQVMTLAQVLIAQFGLMLLIQVNMPVI